MREQRIYRTEAIVLRERDYGEADRILTLLTPLGKLTALAKGIRRPTSHKAGQLGLFFRSRLLLARGRTFQIVSQAESLEEYEGLRASLERFTYACYAAELVDRFAQEGEENEPLYALMADGLRWCAQEADLSLWMRFFELRLLSLSGYQPQFFQCTTCAEPLQAVPNFFSSEHGGVLCPRCGAGQAGARRVSLNAQKVLRFLMTHPPVEVRGLRLLEATQREVEALLKGYMEHVLERDLHSVDLIQRLRRELQDSAGAASPAPAPPDER